MATRVLPTSGENKIPANAVTADHPGTGQGGMNNDPMAINDDSPDGADRYLFIGLLLTLFWIPLPVGGNHLWAWSVFEICVFSLAIVWLALFAMGRVSATLAFRRAAPALLLFAVVIVWVIVQLIPMPAALLSLLSPHAAEINVHTQAGTALSLDPASTRAAALKTLAYGVLFAMTLLLVNRSDRLRFLALALIFSGFVQTVFGAFMTLSGFDYGFFVERTHDIGVVAGTFVNSNHLAAYLEMCLALAMGLVLAGMTKTTDSDWRGGMRRLLAGSIDEKNCVRVAAVILIVGLVLTNSRVGNVAFYSSLLITSGYYVLVTRHIESRAISLFAGFLLVNTAFILGIDNLVGTNAQSSGIPLPVQLEIARDTVDIVRDFPLTGIGAGSFASAYPMYDGGQVGNWFYRHAHNDYLQFAGEFGLPGLAMLAGIVVMSLWQAARAQVERRDRTMCGLGCGVMIAIVALLIHSVVDFNLQIPANAATFVVILAMSWQTRWLGRRDDDDHARPAE